VQINLVGVGFPHLILYRTAEEAAKSRASRLGGFPDLGELALSGGFLRSDLFKREGAESLMSDLVVRLADFPEEFLEIKAIRKVVFQEEQGVEEALEFDGKDEICDHLIAFLDDKAVGTARIRYIDDKTVKIERVAVLSTARGQGIGKKIINEALLIIANKKIPEVVINAQEYIKGLYYKLGFAQEGEIFIEAGIPHVKMRKKL
jgi:predicted GNAT family N-acyltransferase